MHRMLDQSEYDALYTSNFVTLPNIKIDCDLFEKEIEPYKPLFRQWGEKHTEFNRKGISVVNLTGRLDDDIDPCCWPQDQYNQKFKTSLYDNMYRVPTELINLKSFDVLNSLKPYMIRSAILWWQPGSHFKPHIDSTIPTPYIRVWGTNKPDKYNFTYLDGSNHFTKKWDKGQIYLCNTIRQHYAEALDKDVYTFFFNFDSSAYDLFMDLKNGKS